MSRIYEVGIIGGGVSGSVSALHLANNGKDTILFEQKDSVVYGPPFCHLHAGGNLYPDITDDQCRLLMKQSIEMARLFPQSIDERPTFVSVPKSEKLNPENIERRLKMLVDFYKELIDIDSENQVLGPVENYYKKYSADDITEILKKPKVDNPKSLDDWMCNAIKIVDYSKLKMPIFMINEYGWNMFRLAAQAQLALESSENCDLRTNTKVLSIKDLRESNLDYNWEIHTEDDIFKVKYLVNSSGFKTGYIEKPLNINAQRLIEFKAAYVSKWDNSNGMLPELIFHGERGTPNGMAQLTPYYGHYYQIHGMTNEITLFDGGLIKNEATEEQPEFNETFYKKLNSGWDKEEVNSRTEKAIDFIARFVPSFSDATVGGPPLFGAQQIVGNDSSLRVAEVSFPEESYARSEIIKASSALSVANKILSNIENNNSGADYFHNNLIENITKTDIDRYSKEIASNRGFPEIMANLLINKE